MNAHAVICSVGDLMVSDSPLYVSVGFGTEYKRIKGHVFESCTEFFNHADVVIGNLETVLYKPNKRNVKEVQMACDIQIIDEIRDAGFNVLNIANNHCLQHGTKSLFDTIKACNENGIACVGLKNDKPIMNKVGDLNLYFLSICLYTEAYQPDEIWYENNIQRVIETIKEAKESDKKAIIVLSIHWGDEFATYPSPTQVELAHLLVDYGADVVLGHHSHVYQGIEKYRDALIVYSQGNFVSDMVPELCRETGIVNIFISQSEDKKEIDYSFVPYYIDDSFIPQKSDRDWFDYRQTELQRILDKSTSNKNYQAMINLNHKKCHNIFRKRFLKGINDYEKRIYIQMISAFVKRIIQRKIGTYPKRFDLERALEEAKKM